MLSAWFGFKIIFKIIILDYAMYTFDMHYVHFTILYHRNCVQVKVGILVVLFSMFVFWMHILQAKRCRLTKAKGKQKVYNLILPVFSACKDSCITSR